MRKITITVDEGSLSARRAWIEIMVPTTIITICIVALRKESVDRNDVIRPAIDVFLASLSARRAWIEIQCVWIPLALPVVALRKESVDRNRLEPATVQRLMRRSPQGERG